MCVCVYVWMCALVFICSWERHFSNPNGTMSMPSSPCINACMHGMCVWMETIIQVFTCVCAGPPSCALESKSPSKTTSSAHIKPSARLAGSLWTCIRSVLRWVVCACMYMDIALRIPCAFKSSPQPFGGPWAIKKHTLYDIMCWYAHSHMIHGLTRHLQYISVCMCIPNVRWNPTIDRHVCMCLWMCVYICIHTCIRRVWHMFVLLFLQVEGQECSASTDMVRERMCVNMYLCMYTYTYVYAYTYTHTHLDTYIWMTF